MPDNFREVGLEFMHQYIQFAGGRLAKELAKGLRKGLNELEAGFLREIDRFQSNCMQTKELRNMQKLCSEGRYAELYFYAKNMYVGGANNEPAMEEMNKRLLKTIDTASDGLKKMLSEIAAAKQHKRAFAAYQKDEVFMLEGESFLDEDKVIYALHSADMSTTKTKVRAVYIRSWRAVGDRVASELASLLQAHPLSAIYLAGGGISDAGAIILAQTAFRDKSLSTFCIVGGKISDTGAKSVAQAARNSRSLTAFYLEGSEISDSGAMAVAEAVKGRSLSVFYLGSGRISDTGAMAVAEAVKGCSLSAFCLLGSEISDFGAIAVSKTMKDCPLSVLLLGTNKISDFGATAVMETLSIGRCASTLSAFCLWGDGISDSGAKMVANAVRGYPRLSEFYIEGQPISGETVAYILESMAGISTIRSVNLWIGEISKEQMKSCLSKVRVARQLKLRFQCYTEAAASVCREFAAEWNAKLAEFRIVPYLYNIFREELILRVPK